MIQVINVINLIKMTSKFKTRNKQRTIENTEGAKSSFSKEQVKIAELYK